MSTRVDFYLLESGRRSPFEITCRLAVKAWERDQPVAIVAGSTSDAAAIDELLWRTPEGRFIPHGMTQPGRQKSAPVTIGSFDSESTRAEVTINLSDDPIRHSGSRILEIIAGVDEDAIRKGKKFNHYQQLGYRLEIHKLK
jgi:DNA polymerase IIIc chi subunit